MQNGKVYRCIFCEDKVLVKTVNGRLALPLEDDIQSMKADTKHPNEFSCTRQLQDIFGNIVQVYETLNFQERQDFFFSSMRPLLAEFETDEFSAVAKAYQKINWNKKNKYCRRCGAEISAENPDGSKTCSKCGLVVYPEISPAIIVAVTKGDRLLLAHNTNFKSNMYSIIAGFVEMGESLEDCVRREVMEEVGLQIKNIRYFSSQPWPFPNGLMIGFTAEWESGDITPDGCEIHDAKWFLPSEFPNLPMGGSISMMLIQDYVRRYNEGLLF